MAQQIKALTVMSDGLQFIAKILMVEGREPSPASCSLSSMSVQQHEHTHTYMCRYKIMSPACAVPTEVRRHLWIPGTEVTDHGMLLCGFLELNREPLEKQSVSRTIKPSLQPLINAILK